jgi:hypothetical protein
VIHAKRRASAALGAWFQASFAALAYQPETAFAFDDEFGIGPSLEIAVRSARKAGRRKPVSGSIRQAETAFIGSRNASDESTPHTRSPP